MNLEDSRILITGGIGFIDSYLVEKLLGTGCEVTAYDNFAVTEFRIEKKVAEQKISLQVMALLKVSMDLVNYIPYLEKTPTAKTN